MHFQLMLVRYQSVTVIELHLLICYTKVAKLYEHVHNECERYCIHDLHSCTPLSH